MFKPIQFTPEVESLVRFVEETDPATIVEDTLAKLRNGTSVKELITASALAIVRSTELPPEHHGGPVHPICGIHAVYNTSKRLAGELSFLPIVQHTALCNNHCHSPQMGPYVMPELEPLEGVPGEVGSYHISDAALRAGIEPGPRDAKDSVTTTTEAFLMSINAKKAAAAEHYYLWLLENLSPGECLNLLLPLAIARNNLDDHHFIFPVYTTRALDCIGWQWAKVLFRPAVRYQARSAAQLPDIGMIRLLDYPGVQALLDDYKLLEIDIPTQSSEAETELIGELGRQIGMSKNYFETIEPLAKALADGLSLEGAGEVLSYGSALAYLSTSYGNPMDSHLHTGTNNRRYLLRVEGVSLKNKLLALLTGLTGPEVMLAESLINWSTNVDTDITASLPERTQAQLLDAITESIEGQPWIDWRTIGVAEVVAPDEVKETVALARQYAELGYDAGVYFERLAEISCRDDFTEMHALKHFQAIVDEYYATREPFRWAHLVAAAKSAAIIHVGREHSIYQHTKELLVA